MKNVELQLGKWRIEPTRNIISCDGIEKSLEPRVMDTLVLLVSESPHTVATDELMAKIWPGRVVETGAVHRVINKLRAALDDSSKNPSYIETVSMRGYRMVAESSITTLADEPDEKTAEVDADSRPVDNKSFASPNVRVTPRRLWWATGLIGCACLALFLVWFVQSLKPEEEVIKRQSSTPALSPSNWAPSIAILPFKNNGEGASQLADALTEQIITDLTGPRLASARRRFPLVAGGIKVLASRTTQRYAEEFESPSSIGKALDVKFLLSGVVDLDGDASRILLRLIRTDDGEQIWSKTYTEHSLDSFQTASIISLNAGVYIIERMPNDYWYRSLEETFSTFDSHQSFVLAHQGTMRVGAGEFEDQKSIAANYEKALEGAPSLFFANMFLANTYSNLLNQSLQPGVSMQRLNSLISKLEKEIKPKHSNWQKGNVKALRAKYHMFQQDYQSSYALVREVLATNPNSIHGHVMLADFYLYTGSLDGALQEYQRALEVGGSVPIIYIALARYLATHGQAEAGIALIENNLALTPAIHSKCLMMVNQASIMLAADHRPEAISLADKASAMCLVEQPGMFMSLLVELERRDQAIEILKREEKAIDPDAINILDTYFLLGDVEQVLAWIKIGEGNMRVNRWIRFKRNFGRNEGPHGVTLAQLLNHPDFVSAEGRLPTLVL
jgi:DNA-binding winged helix-turn-helix (wHTH) protein/TolB-like protein/tetratricopeptide (TPR) repeat protein